MSDLTASDDIQPIVPDQLARIVRSLNREIAASLLAEMARQDKDLAFIARRLSTSEKSVRRALNRLIDGNVINMDTISDLCLALGCEPKWGLQVNHA